jgi:hypothetical protein
MASRPGFLGQRGIPASRQQPNFLEMRQQAPVVPQAPDRLQYRYLGDPDQQESTVVPDWRGGGVAIEKPGGGYYTPAEWDARSAQQQTYSQPAPRSGPSPLRQQVVTTPVSRGPIDFRPAVTPAPTTVTDFGPMWTNPNIPSMFGPSTYGQNIPAVVPQITTGAVNELQNLVSRYGQGAINWGGAPWAGMGEGVSVSTPGGPASTPEGRKALNLAFGTRPALIGGVGGGVGGVGDEIPPGHLGYQWKPEEIVAALRKGVDVVDGREIGPNLYGLNGEIRAVGLTDKRLFQFGPDTAIYEGVDWYFNSDGVLVPGNFLYVPPEFFDPPVGGTGPQFTARGGGGPAPPFGFAQGAIQGISPVIPPVDTPAALPDRFGPINLNRSFLDLPEAALASLPSEQLARLAPFLEAQGFSGIGNVGQFGERTYEHAALPGDVSTLFTQAQIDLISDPQFKSWMQYLLGELGIFGSRVPVPNNAT